MRKFETTLSKGSVLMRLILFVLPFLVSNIIQSHYNVADMLIVGGFRGEISMSGINIGGQVTFIITNITIGLCAGATVLITQNVGSGVHKNLKETILVF